MNRLEEFANETGIFGLNLLHQQVSKFEKIFWLILTIIFAGATIRDLRDIIRIYVGDTTLTSVSLNYTEPVTFDPPPTIVFIMRDTFVEKNSTSNSTLTQILESTFSETKRPKTLPDLLFNINVRLFSQISNGIELPILYPFLYEKQNKISTDLLFAYNFYRENNISLVYIQKLTGVMVCQKIGFRVNLPGNANITNVCKPDFVTEMYGTEVMLTLGSKPIAYYNTMDFLVMQIDRAYIQYIEKIYIDLYAAATFWNDDADSIEIGLTESLGHQEHIQYRIEPVLEYKKVKRSTQDCNLDPDIYCLARCVANKFFDCAKCWPLTAHFHIRPWNITSICPGENPLTYSSKLQSCMQTRATNETFLTECKLFCQQQPPPCKVRIFTFTKELVVYNESDKIFSIRCYIPSFAFPVFEERIALSWQTFLAQFGGTLGLYLGASFASLVHIPIFFIRVFASKCAKTHSKAKSNEEIELRIGTLQGEISEISSRFAAMEERMAELTQTVKFNKLERTTAYI